MSAQIKSVLVIEDLHVSGMLKNHHLAQTLCPTGGEEAGTRRRAWRVHTWESFGER
jgi:hypothetical protein